MVKAAKIWAVKLLFYDSHKSLIQLSYKSDKFEISIETSFHWTQKPDIIFRLN